MNFLSLLGYINKFSIIAFVVSMAFIVIQIYLYKKDPSRKNKLPTLPDFSEKKTLPKINYSKVPPPEKKVRKKSSLNLFFLVFFTVMIMSAVIFIISYRENKKGNDGVPSFKTAAQSKPSPTAAATATPAQGTPVPTITEPAKPTPTIVPSATAVPPTVTLIPTATSVPTGTPAAVGSIYPTAPPTGTLMPTESVFPTAVTSLPQSGITGMNMLISALSVALIFAGLIL